MKLAIIPMISPELTILSCKFKKNTVFPSLIISYFLEVQVQSFPEYFMGSYMYMNMQICMYVYISLDILIPIDGEEIGLL